jgi:hypothetical protein
MSVHSRQTKVFAALLVSITAGAIILKALGNNPPSAGAFCLSRYYGLSPVEKCILSRAAQYPQSWSHIEIYYSSTKPGGAGIKADATSEHINGHFVICNGRIGYDGQILPTEEWQRQHSIIPEQNPNGKGVSQPVSFGPAPMDFCQPTRLAKLVGAAGKTPIHHSKRTIYISVMADDKAAGPVRNSTTGNMIQKGKISNAARPTDFQIKRTEALVEGLSRKFDIRPESIHYPDNWQ